MIFPRDYPPPLPDDRTARDFNQLVTLTAGVNFVTIAARVFANGAAWLGCLWRIFADLELDADFR
jgi:hypothetical protein